MNALHRSREASLRGNVSVAPRAAGRRVRTARMASTVATSSSTLEFRPVVSSHPDAIRRRQEFEAMLRQREAERAGDAERQRTGKKWWNSGPAAPSNLQTVEDPGELLAILDGESVDPRLIVVNFFTEDCYTCKTLYPKVKQLAESHPGVVFVKANGSADNMQPAFQRLAINRVPYFHLYKGGQLVEHFSASLNPEKLAHLRLAVRSHC